MSVQLVIAEKPSVARSIAAVIGATEKQNGYWQGGGYLVSWCIGHLVSFAEAGQYLGLLAGVNAARLLQGEDGLTFSHDAAADHRHACRHEPAAHRQDHLRRGQIGRAHV